MINTNLKSVLLVDDDNLSNLLNKLLIEKLNIEAEVDAVLNGQQAIDLLTEKDSNGYSSILAPCLLMLDINMPVMNGWQFLEQYENLIPKQLKDQIVIVMFTVSKEQNDSAKAMKNPHIKQFIKKPLSENSFIELINRHFEGEIEYFEV